MAAVIFLATMMIVNDSATDNRTSNDCRPAMFVTGFGRVYVDYHHGWNRNRQGQYGLDQKISYLCTHDISFPWVFSKRWIHQEINKG